MATVLIAEDDADIADLLALYLSSDGFEVMSAPDGEKGLDILGTNDIDLMLVDIMMPIVNGFDFIKQAREISDAPIIVVSARDRTADKSLGLGLGADGYITKPFDPLEIVALAKALLRRYEQTATSGNAEQRTTITIGAVELDTESLVLRKDGNAIALTAAELKIMAKLMKHPGRVFTKAQLYEAVNGTPCLGGEESVMVHISNIRAKMNASGNEPDVIVTVRGLGYRIDA